MEGKLTKEEIETAEKFLDPEGVENRHLQTVSKKGNFKEVTKVIETSDVLVQVLDARDPMGTRSSEIDEMAKEKGVKVIYILNKADLVPAENLSAWTKAFK